MKKTPFALITILCAFVIVWPNTLKACSPGSVTPVGTFIIYDNGADQNTTYAIYVVLSDGCPSQSSPVPLTPLTFAQLGVQVTIGSGPISLDLPDDAQSYYYFKIHIVVQKLYNGTPVGSPLTRYSYATYDAGALTLTAMTQPISISF